MSDDEAISDRSDYSSEVRPNRFKGISQQWQYFTERERGEYASVIQSRNKDLSIHLYNAHALRQRAKEFQEDPLNARVNREYSVIPENHRTFKPPRRWTAWPLLPHEVPRNEETEADTDGSRLDTLRKIQIQRSGTELEDVLFGITLKFARQRFEARKSESDKEENLLTDSVEDIENRELTSTGVDEKVPKNPPASSLKPVSSLDDDISRQLLRPSIHHRLTELDKVLMALHHCRKTCHHHSNSEPYTDDEFVSALAPAKRSKGRPRKFAPITDDFDTGPQLESQSQLHMGSSSTKKTRRGRPPKSYERLNGESQQEFVVRIARMKKKTIPEFTPSTQSSPFEKLPKQKSTPLMKNFSSSSKDHLASRPKSFGLRDWSEVLGTAAIVQIPANIIARATQRCANLFEEGMVMRSIVEAPFTKNDADFTTHYKPLPVLPLPGSVSDHDSCGYRSSDSGLDVENIASDVKLDEIPRASTDLEPRSHNVINRHPKASREEMAQIVNVDLELTDSFPSDEDVDGAVHVDGFLKRIKMKGEVIKKRKLERESQIEKRHITKTKITPESSSTESSWTSDPD